MKNLVIFLFVILFSCKQTTRFEADIHNDQSKGDIKNSLKESEKKVIKDEANLNESLITNTSLDSTIWIAQSFVNSINNKGINQRTVNDDGYPFEIIYIKNWKRNSIYSESAGLDYRKLRTTIINDSTYYLTNRNTHHFRSTDSIYIVKRKNQISIVTKNDSIPYQSKLDNFSFRNQMYNELLNNIYVQKKKFNLYNSQNNILEKGIYFQTNKIINSQVFKSYRFSNYFFKNRYSVNINNKNYFFYWKVDSIYLEQKNKLKYILKKVN